MKYFTRLYYACTCSVSKVSRILCIFIYESLINSWWTINFRQKVKFPWSCLRFTSLNIYHSVQCEFDFYNFFFTRETFSNTHTLTCTDLSVPRYVNFVPVLELCKSIIHLLYSLQGKKVETVYSYVGMGQRAFISSGTTSLITLIRC